MVHVVQKLIDLDELMPPSSSAHLLFEQEVDPGQTGKALEIGVLTVLAHVDSASDRRKGDSFVAIIQESVLSAAYDDMEDRSSSQIDQNKDARHDVASAPSDAVDPVA